jgi:hypothetical protein
MRSMDVWRLFIAIAVTAVLGVSACSRPPAAVTDDGLDWDQGSWDVNNWK